MKNVSVSFVLGFVLPLAIGCGGDADSNFIDPSDPNALSAAIVIPGATRVTGDPPTASGTAGAPTISGGSDLNVDSGGQGVIEVSYDSPTGYENCYVQVIGADDYFLIDNASSASTSGTIQIPINIPDSVDTGIFDLYTCIAGPDGAVSNPVSTAVGVTNPGSIGGGGGGGDVICSDGGVSCPNGASLQFCVNQNGSSCYYSVGGTQVPCGNCTDVDSLTACATNAVNLCI